MGRFLARLLVLISLAFVHGQLSCHLDDVDDDSLMPGRLVAVGWSAVSDRATWLLVLCRTAGGSSQGVHWRGAREGKPKLYKHFSNLWLHHIFGVSLAKASHMANCQSRRINQPHWERRQRFWPCLPSLEASSHCFQHLNWVPSDH